MEDEKSTDLTEIVLWKDDGLIFLSTFSLKFWPIRYMFYDVYMTWDFREIFYTVVSCSWSVYHYK